MPERQETRIRLLSAQARLLSSWRNIGAFSQDDNRSDFINIGFDFWYNGVRYTQVSASTNGYLDFSSSTDDGAQQPMILVIKTPPLPTPLPEWKRDQPLPQIF